MYRLNGTILHKICPSLPMEKADAISAALIKISPTYGIDTADIVHEFIANLCEESGEFRVTVENMNYSTVALRALFEGRITELQATAYGRNGEHPANQVMIANTIYGGPWGAKNLGNINPGDGWLFRGKGMIQITGRANITRFTSFINKKLGKTYTPEEVANLIETDLEMSVHSACWIFAVAKQLIDEAIADDMKTIVHKINGGSLNMPLRLHYLELAQNEIREAG